MQILAHLEKISSNAIGSALGLKITTNLTSWHPFKTPIKEVSCDLLLLITFAPTPSQTVWLLGNTWNFTTLRLPREFHLHRGKVHVLHQRWLTLSKGKDKKGKANIYIYIYLRIFWKAWTEAIFKCRLLCFRPSSQNPVELVSPPRIPSNAEEALTMDVQIKMGQVTHDGQK